MDVIKSIPRANHALNIEAKTSVIDSFSSGILFGRSSFPFNGRRCCRVVLGFGGKGPEANRANPERTAYLMGGLWFHN